MLRHMTSMKNTVAQESMGEATRALPRLSSTACLRCREQKVSVNCLTTKIRSAPFADNE